MELIDKQKLLEWLSRNIDANQLSQGGIALRILREKIESGTFDNHSTQEEIAKLKEERELLENRAEDAKNDRDTFAREMHEYRRRAHKAEQERDELLNELEWFIREYPESSSSARSIIAKIEGK